jgi:hypothetical protein
MLSPDLVKIFKNESIRINLLKDDKPQVNFKIESRDTKKCEITIRLEFKNPKDISRDAELDEIQVTFL